jgi:signal transduction histidine kinase
MQTGRKPIPGPVATPERRRELRATLRLIAYVWVCVAFLYLWMHFSYVRSGLTVPRERLSLLFGLGVATMAVRHALGLRYGGSLWHGALFNLLAVAFISMAVAMTGRIESDFWLVYFVLLISETLLADHRMMIATDAVVAVSYIVATWPGEVTVPYIEQVTTRVFFLVLVGAIARAIAANERARSREVALLQEQVRVGEERTRIAREIHDGVGHALTGVILQIELCQRLMRRDLEAAEVMLAEQKGVLRHAMDEARELVFHLRPIELAIAGFAPSVRRYAQQLARRGDLAIDLSLPEGELPLSPAGELALARIIQEALANAARHSGARRIEVDVRVEKKSVTCRIEDDGRGFDPAAPPRDGAVPGERGRGGFGIVGMRERAAELGGALEIETISGQGARIRVTLPTVS